MNTNLVLTLEYKKPKLLLKIVLLFLLALFITIIAGFTYLTIKTNKFFKEFSQAANLSKEEVIETASNSISQFRNNYRNIAELPKKYNFLILGTDKLSGRDGDPELTDTILFLQTDFSSGKIKTLAFPRDLYLKDYQTKINALYFYGKDKYPDSPEKFPKEVIEQLSGQAIDHTIVLGIEDLEKLIEIVGEVEIDVPVSFTDSSFPVPGIDVSVVTDPKILYEEISFTNGLQKMSSATALKYMRSRYSEGDEGTDEARAYRQQLVLQSLFNQILTIRDPQKLGQLYRFYLDHFSSSISMEQIIQIGTVFADYINKNQTEINFEKHQLSIYPENENGVIYNPPLWQSKQQWIYEIRDQDKFTESINVIFN